MCVWGRYCNAAKHYKGGRQGNVTPAAQCVEFQTQSCKVVSFQLFSSLLGLINGSFDFCEETLLTERTH